jgi:hypothetical protein
MSRPAIHYAPGTEDLTECGLPVLNVDWTTNPDPYADHPVSCRRCLKRIEEWRASPAPVIGGEESER